MSFDKNLALRAVGFCESLTFTGDFAGKRLTFQTWQRDVVSKIFGTLRKDGFRQYRTVYLELPRKNGKTEMAAALGLYMLTLGGGSNRQIYGAAADREQAALVYTASTHMMRNSKPLSKRIREIPSKKRLVFKEANSFFQVLSSEAYTKHGLGASCVIFDELHAQPNRDLWDVLQTSMASRFEPLTIVLTTAGFDRHSICWEVHEYATKILNGQIEDETFLPIIYKADEEDDWTLEETWKKANPNYGISIMPEYIRAECKKAQQIPAYENTFRRLHLNQWTSQDTRLIPMDKWNACYYGAVDPVALETRPCFGGLDLSSSIDITAFVLLFPPVPGEDYYTILPHFWIPSENLEERNKRDGVRYDLWAKQGLLTILPGNAIEDDFIIKHIKEAKRRYKIRTVGFDRFGSKNIVQKLMQASLDVAEIGQGFVSMSAPTKEMLAWIYNRKLNHGKNPILDWMADNMVAKMDPAGNLKPDKSKSTKRIDGMVALIMAIDQAMRNPNLQPYQDGGILVL